ncbi:CopD family protein [Gordonia rhizosphera]|uniref:Putative copper resistance protein n=1 Tax=Gordonia rhizosphera NBRC 16068 TaxID=1108045 RepID=K6WL30_9ACTN|nr:CopD family protein [Gordonia rhizosphera]GAB92822.1 putative copper resistance protein [Gordonia rhizosphera NBRC 16068]
MQLFTTVYGRYLGIKLLMVLGLLIAGAYNVRVLLPRIRAARADGDDSSALRLVARNFPVVVAIESVLAIGVLVIVPFLRGSARQEAGWDDARSFDLTVFGTGVLLVALVAAALWFGSRTPEADASPADRPLSQRL